MKPTDPKFIEQCNKSNELKDTLFGGEGHWYHGNPTFVEVKESTTYNSTPVFEIWGHAFAKDPNKVNEDFAVNSAVLPKGEYSVFWFATCNSAGEFTFVEGKHNLTNRTEEDKTRWMSANMYRVPWYNLSIIPMEALKEVEELGK